MYYYTTFNFVGYGLIIIAFLVTLIADIYLRTRYSKYKKVEVKSGKTGAEAAREILAKNGLDNIYVVETKAQYNARMKANHDNEMMGIETAEIKKVKFFDECKKTHGLIMLGN